jgi:hypothetical protein
MSDRAVPEISGPSMIRSIRYRRLAVLAEAGGAATNAAVVWNGEHALPDRAVHVQTFRHIMRLMSA